jgi:hypothetical protein
MITFDRHLRNREAAGEKFVNTLAARELGVSSQCVAYWRSGARRPRDVETIQKIKEWSGGAVTEASWFMEPETAA